MSDEVMPYPNMAKPHATAATPNDTYPVSCKNGSQRGGHRRPITLPIQQPRQSGLTQLTQWLTKENKEH
jgi:hypothetical protein